jgi:hypothetical protein
VRAVQERNWDPSVKSMAAFPQLLSMMDEKLDWTERLGDAFLAQSSQVMDSVQGLRQRAYAAGTLRSTDQYKVENRERVIVVEPARPDVVYVPYYDPYVAYGGWYWAGYPPVYWAPWPGYAYRPGFVGFRFSVGINIGHGFFFGAFNWPQRHVTVVNVNSFYYPRVVHRTVVVNQVWHHDPMHRRGVVYRNPQVRHEYTRVNAPQVRREYPQHTRPSRDYHRDTNRQAHNEQPRRNDDHRGNYPRRDSQPNNPERAHVGPQQRQSSVRVSEQRMAPPSAARNLSPMQDRKPTEMRAPAVVEPRAPAMIEPRAPTPARAPTFQRPGDGERAGRSFRGQPFDRNAGDANPRAGSNGGGFNRSGGMAPPGTMEGSRRNQFIRSSQADRR